MRIEKKFLSSNMEWQFLHPVSYSQKKTSRRMNHKLMSSRALSDRFAVNANMQQHLLKKSDSIFTNLDYRFSATY